MRNIRISKSNNYNVRNGVYENAVVKRDKDKDRVIQNNN